MVTIDHAIILVVYKAHLLNSFLKSINMLVEELIEILKTKNPKAIILVHTDNFEKGNSLIEASYVNQSLEGKSSDKQFTDAFGDNDRYISTVWNTIGGDKPVVTIS
jgi:hypothetical protein